MPIRTLELRCVVLRGDHPKPFVVRIDENFFVSELKEMIKTRAAPQLNNVFAPTLPLWKCVIPMGQEIVESVRLDGTDRRLSRIAGDCRLSELWSEDLPSNAVHILAQAPHEETSPPRKGSRIDHDLSDEVDSGPRLKRARLISSEVPDWLQELHKKLWNRKELHEELFHSVTLTLADYSKLQDSMTKLYPNREEKDCRAGTDGVLAAKLAVLQSTNNLVTDHHVTQPTNHDDDQTEGDDKVDEELRSLFPFPLEYLDLSSLHLQSPPPRMPLPLLVREEYKFLSKLLDDLPKGGTGSAIISGQPGIGKTAYLYYQLIQSMLAGTRCLYQTIPTERDGNAVYLIDSSIKVVKFWPNEHITAFFDADGPSSRPAEFLLNHLFVKIIAACSPNNAFQQWIKKPVCPTWVSRRITTLWSRKELFLTGMFLAPADLSYSRLRELTTYFGFNPRHCFHAPPSIKEAMLRIQIEIEGCSAKMCLEDFWRETRSTKSISHSVFQLSPSINDDERLLDDARILPVSTWALTALLNIYKKHQANASYEFYKLLKRLPGTGPLRGAMFEVQVLEYLAALKGQKQFTIRSLSSSDTDQWTYPGPTTSSFSHSSTFTQSLRDAVTQKISLLLVPQPNFAAVDAILYTPGDVLTGIQVTVNTVHTVAVVGLQCIQGWLKQKSILDKLRPSVRGDHWRLIFVVPEDRAFDFEIQTFEGNGSDGWLKKVDQWVLGMNEDTIWGRASQLSSSS